MEIRKLYRFYALGWDYRGMTKGQRNNSAKESVRVLKNFKQFLEDHDMHVTLTAIKDEYDNIVGSITKQDPDSVLTEANSNNVKEFAESIEKTLDSELRLRNAYVLSGKRLGLEKLLEKTEELFPVGCYDKLPDFAKKDFSEAGKCIAYERNTAAAFHILRGTEETLREFYKIKIKQKRVKNLLWYDMTKHLEKKRGIPKALIAVLDTIREDFRNPTAHPDKVYLVDEVQTLFTHCADVVNRIVKLQKS